MSTYGYSDSKAPLCAFIFSIVISGATVAGAYHFPAKKDEISNVSSSTHNLDMCPR